MKTSTIRAYVDSFGALVADAWPRGDLVLRRATPTERRESLAAGAEGWFCAEVAERTIRRACREAGYDPELVTMQVSGS